MSDALLLLSRLLLLALLYLFLWRVVRVVASDLRGDRPATPTRTRPETTSSERDVPTRRVPRQLVVHQPSGEVVRVDLADTPVRIGRADDVTVPIEDDYVSDEHLEFTPVDDGWVLRDLGSTNGTHLNGAKVVGATPVAAGDQVSLGKTRVEVRR